MPSPQTYFLDTNLLVYAFERDLSEKQRIAQELIADHLPWQISWHVVQEFCHVSIHRFKEPLTHNYLDSLVELLLAPHCTVYPASALWKHALRIQTETQYRFYDSLIIAGAIESGAPVLYSEDLQHNRQIGSLRIINPFH